MTPNIASGIERTDSPGPVTSIAQGPDAGNEILKLSFRAGGEKIFFDRLRDALIQRKWLLQNAPSVPRSHTGSSDLINADGTPSAAAATRKRVGIAGLERRDQEMRRNNEIVIGSAFEDLEALMISAKEVIAMAERFAAQSSTSSSTTTAEASALLSESASALGLITTKDMLTSPGSNSTSTNSSTLYTTQLSRDLAELLTDDRHALLARAGGIISLVDLWALVNRRRNGIELASPRDFELAARQWDALRLPVRLRRFRSGLLVVQGRDRSDERTVEALLRWLAEAHEVPPEACLDADSSVSTGGVASTPVTWDWRAFGRGVTVLETAARFGWSVGVAAEELEMAEERGALVREQDAQGVRFWENHFGRAEEGTTLGRVATPEVVREERLVTRRLQESEIL